MKILSTLLTLLLSLALPLLSAAQEKPQTVDDSAALLHQNGQIYLVVLVLTTIFAGILIMLIVLERKLNKLEKNKS